MRRDIAGAGFQPAPVSMIGCHVQFIPLPHPDRGYAAAVCDALRWMIEDTPGPDGYCVARALKSMARPPVVVSLRLDGDNEARRRGLEAGGDAIAVKDEDWEVLLTQIRTAPATRPKGSDRVKQYLPLVLADLLGVQGSRDQGLRLFLIRAF